MGNPQNIYVPYPNVLGKNIPSFRCLSDRQVFPLFCSFPHNSTITLYPKESMKSTDYTESSFKNLLDYNTFGLSKKAQKTGQEMNISPENVPFPHRYAILMSNVKKNGRKPSRSPPVNRTFCRAYSPAVPLLPLSPAAGISCRSRCCFCDTSFRSW